MDRATDSLDPSRFRAIGDQLNEADPGGALAIVGSRGFLDENAVRELVRTLHPSTLIVSGGAEGPDTWAVDEAVRRGNPVLVIRPEWKRADGSYDRGAGKRRNESIVLRVDRGVYCFWDGKSGGTFSTIQLARKHHRRLWIHYPDGSTEYEANRLER